MDLLNQHHWKWTINLVVPMSISPKSATKSWIQPHKQKTLIDTFNMNDKLGAISSNALFVCPNCEDFEAFNSEFFYEHLIKKSIIKLKQYFFFTIQHSFLGYHYWVTFSHTPHDFLHTYMALDYDKYLFIILLLLVCICMLMAYHILKMFVFRKWSTNICQMSMYYYIICLLKKREKIPD